MVGHDLAALNTNTSTAMSELRVKEEQDKDTVVYLGLTRPQKRSFLSINSV